MGTEQEIFDSVEAEDEREEGQQPEQREGEGQNKEQAAREPSEGEKQPDATAQGAAQEQGKTEPPAQPQHQVPLRELLDTRERAQKAETGLAEALKRLEALERERKTAEEKPRETPDMFADPEGFVKSLTQTFEQRLEAERLQRDVSETQREFARLQKEHGETFTTAWTEFVKAAESAPALRQAFDALPAWQRGEEVLGWYRKQVALREVGDDPAAYRQKVLDEALNDEAFIGKVIEKVRGQAGAPNNGSGRNVTRFPPSLNRQTSAATAHVAEDTDDSEEAIFEAATPARR